MFLVRLKYFLVMVSPLIIVIVSISFVTRLYDYFCIQNGTAEIVEGKVDEVDIRFDNTEYTFSFQFEKNVFEIHNQMSFPWYLDYYRVGDVVFVYMNPRKIENSYVINWNEVELQILIRIIILGVFSVVTTKTLKKIIQGELSFESVLNKFIKG